MKQFFKFLFLFLSVTCASQQSQLTNKYKSKISKRAVLELKNRYVFPERATLIEDKFTVLEKRGDFKKFKSLEKFAAYLTEVIYEVSCDKHIGISLKSKTNEQDEDITSDPQEAWLRSRMEEREYFRKFNANFKTIDKKEGNVGYLDLRGFYGVDFGRDFARYAMSFLSTSDAIIIDLRNNSGGRGDMVNFLLGYFFEQPIITGKSIKRSGDSFEERTSMSSKTNSLLVMPEVPLYVLTSSKTFSAAEAFSYPLKVYERATFIGELTKGGANAGDLIDLDDKLQIFIPDVAGLPHPVSHEIFEGKGIVPDIPTKSENALEKAMGLAVKAAEIFRRKKDSLARQLLIELNNMVDNYKSENEEEIISLYKKCRRNNLVFEQWELNRLAESLMSKNPTTASVILKTSAIIYPYSSEAQFKYAQALLKGNRKSRAKIYLKKAADIAKENEEEQLKFYKQQLQAFQEN